VQNNNKMKNARHMEDKSPFFLGGEPASTSENAGEGYSFIPSDDYNPIYDPYFNEQSYNYDSPVDKKSKSTQKRSSGTWWLVALVSLVAIVFMVFTIYKEYGYQSSFNQKLEWMQRNTIFDGVFIDGVHVGVLDKQSAINALKGSAHTRTNNMNMSVNIDGKTWLITDREIPFKTNLESVVEKAYCIGRRGFIWNKENGDTPFETRFLHTQQTIRDKAYLSTEISYNTADVRRISDEISSQINKQAVNAVISSFDYNTKKFTVTQDVKGAELNTDELYREILSNLQKGDYNAQINLSSTPLMPQVTSVELQNGFSKLSEYSTKTTNDNKRNVNISLAAKAINGTCVMPGESFSFNKATGERTQEKGYMPAPAISGGVSLDETGGGVCQVSSTLFNAAAIAGMTIIDRSPHPWPSNYIDKGLDATVNWPNLDFAFRNDKSTPVFIVASYKSRQITVEMYGMQTGAGESIRLETKLISTNKPPDEPKYVQNTLLAPGTIRQTKKARTGYVVDTYRVYLRNGQEYRRETLCTSNYRPIQQEIEYNR